MKQKIALLCGFFVLSMFLAVGAALADGPPTVWEFQKENLYQCMGGSADPMVEVDSQDNVIMAYECNWTLFVLKFDSAGQWQWTVAPGGGPTTSRFQLDVDGDDNIITSGPGWVARLDTDGNLLWKVLTPEFTITAMGADQIDNSIIIGGNPGGDELQGQAIRLSLADGSVICEGPVHTVTPYAWMVPYNIVVNSIQEVYVIYSTLPNAVPGISYEIMDPTCVAGPLTSYTSGYPTDAELDPVKDEPLIASYVVFSNGVRFNLGYPSQMRLTLYGPTGPNNQTEFSEDNDILLNRLYVPVAGEFINLLEKRDRNDINTVLWTYLAPTDPMYDESMTITDMAVDSEGDILLTGKYAQYIYGGPSGTGVYQEVRLIKISEDQDHDDSFWYEDCDDLDPSRYPGAPEIKHDGIDQDCNGYDLTIDITAAEYSVDDDTLKVYATSFWGEQAALSLASYGPMSWKENKQEWQVIIESAGGDPGTVEVCGFEGCDSTPTQPK